MEIHKHHFLSSSPRLMNYSRIITRLLSIPWHMRPFQQILLAATYLAVPQVIVEGSYVPAGYFHSPMSVVVVLFLPYTEVTYGVTLKPAQLAGGPTNLTIFFWIKDGDEYVPNLGQGAPLTYEYRIYSEKALEFRCFECCMIFAWDERSGKVTQI